VTLELLHLEYLEQHPTGLRYTAFCDDYRKWLAKTSVTMRQLHKAGEKCFVDFSGVRPFYLDSATGEQVFVELFVAVLGASNFTYAEVVSSQKVEDFVGARVFRRRAGDAGARRIEGGGDRPVSIRAWDPAHVR
jgi:transposase